MIEDDDGEPGLGWQLLVGAILVIVAPFFLVVGWVCMPVLFAFCGLNQLVGGIAPRDTPVA